MFHLSLLHKQADVTANFIFKYTLLFDKYRAIINTILPYHDKFKNNIILLQMTIPILDFNTLWSVKQQFLYIFNSFIHSKLKIQIYLLNVKKKNNYTPREAHNYYNVYIKPLKLERPWRYIGKQVTPTSQQWNLIVSTMAITISMVLPLTRNFSAKTAVFYYPS